MAILDDVSSRVTIHHGHLDGRSPGAPSAPGLGPPRRGPGTAGAGGAGEGEAEGLALSSDGFHGGVKGCLMTNDGYGRIYNVFW